MTSARQQRSAFSSISRLGPYIRPVRVWFALAVLTTACAMAAGLIIPLVIQRILDGPVAHHDTSGLLWPVVGVALLGLAEAVFFFCRRRLVARPISLVERTMRGDLYEHLQHLPTSFHDNW